MGDIKKLPESELEIMMIIWDAKEKVTSDYIMDRINKDWMKTTVLNFLTRLCDRGFLKCHKEGRFNVYEPLVEKEDYLQKESKFFFKKSITIPLQVLWHHFMTATVFQRRI